MKIHELVEKIGKKQHNIVEVSNGYNIRMLAKEERLILKFSIKDRFCKKCGSKENLHVHHIIGRLKKLRDHKDNLIVLCLNCHVGNNGIHKGRWKIEEIVSREKIKTLKERYGLVR